ncbi:MAG: EamA family transporter [Candidatus Latescibacterota bacterium]|nr:MAG: EamA family transporter [Candidatus Latescibacterota bacterium]
MKLREWAAFLSLTFIWGASFLWIKIAVQEIDPFSLVTFRIILGLIGLAVFFPIQKPKIPRRFRTWVDMALLGLLSSAIPWVLISWAEETIDSALAGVLNGTVPLFTILIAHLFIHDDRMTYGRVVGLLVGFAGVVVLTQRDGGGTNGGLSIVVSRHLLGQGAMLLAALSYAVGGVYARRHLRNVSALVQAFFSMVFSLVVLQGVIPLIGGAVAVPARVETWVALAWLGVLGAGVASYIFYYLLHAIGPTRASLVTYTIPVVSVTLGVIVLGERLDWALAAGTVLIVSGVWVVNRKSS